MGLRPGAPVRATYRVQLRREFGFDDVARIAPYLARLGVSHVYLSPILQAGRGSTHGYDVLAHDRLNEELGGASAYDRMCAALEAHNLRQIVDIVPNHMAISSPENRWWWDVLKNGAASDFAPFFDIDWDPPETKLRHTILMPILGDHYGRVLKRGEIVVDASGADPIVRYHEHLLPLSSASVDKFLSDPNPQAAAEQVNGDLDLLHDLLEAQHYRLAFWRTASTELDYRRFFDINTLVALRQENPRVFDATHRFVLDLVEAGRVHGLRVDHVDGLRDPDDYLARLRKAAGDAYVVVEKILEPGESLPSGWPVAGTTGYDFLNVAGGLFVDPAGETAITRVHRDFTGETSPYADVVVQRKLQAARELLASDVERLVALFVDVCEATREYRDYTRSDLRDALLETLAAFPVYRTYVTPRRSPDPSDAAYIDVALARVRERRDDVDPELLTLLREVLLMRRPGPAPMELALRFQQTSGPVMAKGVEDTAFYNYNRLVSLNEVGGDPSRFGTSVEDFHDWCLAAAEGRPLGMLATSTHDTKRGEDVRARIHLLSEMPDEWESALSRWGAINERHRTDGLPDRNAEYLLYQTLVGAWPIEIGRVLQFAEKASKEAKTHTSWIAPNTEYDAALRRFVEGVLDDRVFLADLEDFVAPLVGPARVTSLAQTLLKLTAPGVPDLYQGTEVWDSSLVDPDNRRPVDYAERGAALDSVAAMGTAEVWADPDGGAPKLYLCRRALLLRSKRPHCFGPGADYAPLHARGAKAEHVVAFARAGEVVTVVPRLVLGLAGDWADTTLELPPGEWHNALDDATPPLGGRVALGPLLGFPVALLVRESR